MSTFSFILNERYSHFPSLLSSEWPWLDGYEVLSHAGLIYRSRLQFFGSIDMG